MSLSILFLLVVTILAFWISAICGGGASLILMPLLSNMLPGSLVPFSLTIGTFTSSASRITAFRKHINWKIFFWFVPFSIPAVIVGAWAMKFLDPTYLQLLVAIFLIANLPQFFRSKEMQTKEEKPYSKYVLATVGFFAGFISGITGAIGLLFNRFYLHYGLSKEQIIATRAANEISLHLIKLIIYFMLGLYSGPAFYLGLVVALASILSSYTIKFILPHLSEFLFRKIGYSAMVVSGIFLFASTVQNMIQQDKITLSEKNKEATIKWRESSFVLEFAFDDGLEIERPILSEELPADLKTKFETMQSQYDQILLEKVFKFDKEPSYEFYCFRNEKLTKFEYGE